MSLILCLAFFLSGAAALTFETLWFRQAGLMLGNSIWASSLVIAAFMSGLAVGNVWALRRGARIRRPLRAYALLELLVGVTGAGLVLFFPSLTRALTPVLQALTEEPALLNALRMGAAFLVMLVPAAAMGATLPLLVFALTGRGGRFGQALGRLYGWNTLGAVAGALGAETLLLPQLGIRGSSLTAAALNGLAAALAATLIKAEGDLPAAPQGAAPPPGRRAARLLGAAFLAGAILLALEVVWFRFLLLFFISSSLAFATMLAVVLLGIGGGGLAASGWLRLNPDAPRYRSLVALGCGLAGVLAYANFARVLTSVPIELGLVMNHATMFGLSLFLMLPVSAGSGILFTLIGEALRAELDHPTRAAGWLTLANTVGAALGAFAGGLLMLPALGLERSVFALCAAYGGVALLLGVGAPGRDSSRAESRWRVVRGLGVASFVAVVALFPFGLITNHYLRRVTFRWTQRPSSQVVAYREGVSETIFYIRRDLLGEPLNWHLATNGFSMADTSLTGQRYMRLFVHWPMALRPDARKALLISFGVGSTAKALTDTPWLDHIDVVDTSRDILEMGRLIFPRGGYPLDDPRVRVHVEDGRFFLLTTRERYDLVTAEPPPPKNAGIVNLYTREYFQLIYDRLGERGVATYWLPAYQMKAGESQAIAAAFCSVFRDCSLWSGSGPEWMLAGTRNLHGPLAEEGFTRQWKDPTLSRSLRNIGVEDPGQLGALFIADAQTLAEWTHDSPLLDDDHPLRLSSAYSESVDPEYARFADIHSNQERFQASPFIRELWPPAIRDRTGPFFLAQGIMTELLTNPYRPRPALPGIETLGYLLTETSLRTPVLWLMGSTFDEQRVADEALAKGRRDPELDELLGQRAMADRDYRRAEDLLSRVQPPAGPKADQIQRWRTLALLLSGDQARASALLSRGDPPSVDPASARDWSWLAQRVGQGGLPRRDAEARGRTVP